MVNPYHFESLSFDEIHELINTGSFVCLANTWNCANARCALKARFRVKTLKKILISPLMTWKNNMTFKSNMQKFLKAASCLCFWSITKKNSKMQTECALRIRQR